MENACPITFDPEVLKREIRTTYARVAEDPGGDFHFHRGPAYAVERLGYLPEEVESLPSFVTAPFAGVGNPLRVGAPPRDATVIDLGSGAGMDCLLAGRHVGPRGRVVGFDMTEAMLDLARAGATASGLTQVAFEAADITDLPVDDGSVDVVVSNGVINLTTDKLRTFREIARVLRPGGRLQFADIVIASELSPQALNDIELWVG